MMGLFAKKVQPSQQAYAVVTGAGSGIGRSFALQCDVGVAEQVQQLAEQSEQLLAIR